MLLQYTDIFTGTIKKNTVEITTDHSASHYGIPVLVMPNGQALNADSWVLLNYQIVKATEAESELMAKWLRNLYTMLGQPIPDAPDKKKCLRCGHTWIPRTQKVVQCPHCKSALWDTPKKEDK